MSLSQPAHAIRTNPEFVRSLPAVGVGLLGCGVVGGGVATLLLNDRRAVAERGGVDFVLRAIAVRSCEKARPEAVDRALLTPDASAVIDDPQIDVVIECIGGTLDAKSYVERALGAGKHVVTANKDLVATEGPRLRELAARHGVTLHYEAAVGGAIPIVRTIRESLAGESILEVGGVLNGTTNFILSEMFAGSTYAAALARAQRMGFAEADPTNDVAGVDAAHKLAILAQLAFGRAVTTPLIERSGIQHLTTDDVSLARRLGLTLKLIAVARSDGNDIAAVVTPAFVRREHPFATPLGPQNCIRVAGKSAGTLTFAGSGAGREPTASAVVGDVIAALRRIASGREAWHAEAPLVPAERFAVTDIPLRRVVRLTSFRDARPANGVLEKAGLPGELIGQAPAVLTGPLTSAQAHGIATALRADAIVPASVVPLWDDAGASFARLSTTP